MNPKHAQPKPQPEEPGEDTEEMESPGEGNENEEPGAPQPV